MTKDEGTQPYKETRFIIPVEVLPIVAATAKKPARYTLDVVQVIRTDGTYTAAATDSRRLLTMTWKTEEKGNGSVLIPREAFKGKYPLFVTDKEKTIEVDQTGKPLQTFVKPENENFPMWEEVVPDKSQNSLEILVDPKLLGNLLLAMAKAQRNHYPISVSLFFDPGEPILLEADAGETKLTGVLMQCNRV
jgi:hypothetical protein